MMSQVRTLVVASILLGVPAVTWAQQTGESARPSITVVGEATITAAADQARIEFAVVTQARTAPEAVSRNAERVTRVIADLKRSMGPGNPIETVGYGLNADYRYPTGGGTPTIEGYTATNTIRVTTNDLDRIGSAIDTAIRAGANNVQSLQFTLRDDQKVQGRALREAATRARAKGDALASALGVHILRVFQVREESPPSVQPFIREVAQAKDMAATPVEPGRIEVVGRVTLVLEIAR